MPGQFLPGSQSSARVANAELESKPLRAGTQQIHSPGIGVTMFDCFKQIAVRRRSIDAGEHRLAALEDLVMQTHLNGRQIDAAVDDDRLLGGGRLHVVYSAFADVHAQQVTQELNDAAVRTAADQRECNDDLAQPPAGDLQLEQHLLAGVRRVDRKRFVQRSAGLALLLVDELAAHAVLGGQFRDRFRARQRPNGQVKTFALRQPRCRTPGSIHANASPQKMGRKCRPCLPSSSSSGTRTCNPRLNYAVARR